VDVFTLAAESGLTAYDASYLWLARTRDAELVTLDVALGRLAVEHWADAGEIRPRVRRRQPGSGSAAR
jgi:hypothetical protein